MKLINGLKLKGAPAEIPDCSRDDLPAFFVEMGYKVGAEIGVYRGEFTKKFCQAGLAMFAIDPWTAYSGSGRSEKIQDNQNLSFEYAQKNLAPYPKCKIIRKTSMDAVKNFKNGSLDFVYIDGDHRFRYIAEDLYEWERKVKSGGAISGHDYLFTNPEATNVIIHVGPVVDAFVKIKGIKNFYVFGHPKQIDRTLSWMFVKP
jgi:hypothetical protein